MRAKTTLCPHSTGGRRGRRCRRGALEARFHECAKRRLEELASAPPRPGPGPLDARASGSARMPTSHAPPPRPRRIPHRAARAGEAAPDSRSRRGTARRLRAEQRAVSGRRARSADSTLARWKHEANPPHRTATLQRTAECDRVLRLDYFFFGLSSFFAFSSVVAFRSIPLRRHAWRIALRFVSGAFVK